MTPPVLTAPLSTPVSRPPTPDEYHQFLFQNLFQQTPLPSEAPAPGLPKRYTSIAEFFRDKDAGKLGDWGQPKTAAPTVAAPPAAASTGAATPPAATPAGTAAAPTAAVTPAGAAPAATFKPTKRYTSLSDFDKSQPAPAPAPGAPTAAPTAAPATAAAPAAPLSKADYLKANPVALAQPRAIPNPDPWKRLAFGLAAAAAGWGRPGGGMETAMKFRQGIADAEQKDREYNEQLPALNQARQDAAYRAYLQNQESKAATARNQTAASALGAEERRAASAAQFATPEGRLGFLKDNPAQFGGLSPAEASEYVLTGKIAQPSAAESKGQWVTDTATGKPVFATSAQIAGAPGGTYAPYAAKAPGAPATKDLLVNGKTVIEAWDPKTGKFDLPVGEAPPSFAQTGFFKPMIVFDPTTAQLMQGSFDERTGTVTAYGAGRSSKDLLPVVDAAVRPLNDAIVAGHEADKRLRVMEENAADAWKGGHADQQAMLSLLANHLGMTTGAQRGARINQAMWDEALKSRPWLQGAAVKFDKDGALSGVVLTQAQIAQMLKLAKIVDQQSWQQASDTAAMYGIPWSPLPPAGALKPGVHTSFGNGQVWTLGTDGLPERIK